MRLARFIHAPLLLAGAVHTGIAFAAGPAGLWRTIDDTTGQAKSLVRITESGGVLNGRIEKILDPKATAGARCTKCIDERKDQPIEGLLILRQVRQQAEDPQATEGGDILDPSDGQLYRVRLKVLAEGRQLQVRGYVGPFYRTQTWQRVE